MNKIYKICLFLIIFIVSAAGAWAGFNYNSANNYFLVDSILKTSGGYLAVGKAFNDVLKKADNTDATNFFAVSNNLIFTNKDQGEFLSGLRQINKENFSSPAITLKNAGHDLLISSVGGSGPLNISANRILMNQSFNITKGLAFDGRDPSNISSNTIYANTVLAKSLELLSSSATALEIPSEDLLAISSKEEIAMLPDSKIKFDNKDFCQLKTWDSASQYSNAYTNKIWPADPSGLHSCDSGYYVFDVNNVSSPGWIACCKYASGKLEFGLK